MSNAVEIKQPLDPSPPSDEEAPRRRNLNAQSAAAMLDSWVASGEDPSAFCARVRVSRKTFDRWRSRLRPASSDDGDAQSGGGLARVLVGRGMDAPMARGTLVEVVAGSPVVVRVSSVVDEVVLQRIVRACRC